MGKISKPQESDLQKTKKRASTAHKLTCITRIFFWLCLLAAIFLAIWIFNDAKNRGWAASIETALIAGVGFLLSVYANVIRSRYVQEHEDNRHKENVLMSSFTTAIEQLGNNSSQTRIAGVYGLEYIAINHADYAERVLNILCGYLRTTRHETKPDNPENSNFDSPVETTILNIFQKHLKHEKHRSHGEDGLWSEYPIDLHGATLTEPLNLEKCKIKNINLKNANIATANFKDTTFSGGASFGNATFSGGAGFGNATFSGGAGFGNATFSKYANFGQATFGGNAGFWGATFSGGADFENATFSKYDGFRHATFSGGASFWDATFGGDADFRRATFGGGAGFGYAMFGGGASFGYAMFGGGASFENATFSSGAGFGGARFLFSADYWWGAVPKLVNPRAVAGGKHYAHLPQGAGWWKKDNKGDLVPLALDKSGDWHLEDEKWVCS